MFACNVLRLNELELCVVLARNGPLFFSERDFGVRRLRLRKGTSPGSSVQAV